MRGLSHLLLAAAVLVAEVAAAEEVSSLPKIFVGSSSSSFASLDKGTSTETKLNGKIVI
jgi:hypothetical protein